MQSNSANGIITTSRKTRCVVFVIYPGVTLLDVTGPAQVFSSANQNSGDSSGQGPVYKILIASSSGGPIATDTGLTLDTVPLSSLDNQSIDTLIVAGGAGVFGSMDEDYLVDWVKRNGEQSRRAGSTCMGTFLVAAAGLLNGRRAVTHWRYCDELKVRFPEINVENDKIFIRDGTVWSSAGVTSGIDMSLAMIEDDLGHETAMRVARGLVLFLKRPGGQSQFSDPLAAQTADTSGTFNDLHAWITTNLDTDLRVERLAERAGMSPRTFARIYTERIGRTPAKSVEMLRLDRARSLLENSDMALTRIVGQCGFGDEQRMRRVFQRHLQITPNEYRHRFGS